ncbi:TonB-linked SusC/RagA family outer membrane protein [Chitinophaga skermanii]|uniref:TonB-linked SusC/RagA family outer membrane protein n=1 Tax=Chitinophaga skermanii TaxID=331697 RepID=A0A327R4Q8_9BACT|nr:SusC/RagA family TonB-linked outer membrane protein [Chitinophaga skermanii]RAJ10713.1 TonB-linked SusC/RagA family outer membrane protein [Chitinophaga skermanii]
MRRLSLKLFTVFSIYILSVIFIQAQANRSEVLINIPKSEVTLKSALSLIEKQSKYTFFYSHTQVNRNQKVTVDFKNERLDKVLQTLLYPHGLGYKYAGDQILIFERERAAGTAWGSNNIFVDTLITLTGQIKDNKGTPLEGVSISIKGFAIGTISKQDGTFALEKVPQNSNIVVSLIGYIPQYFLAKDSKIIFAVLEPSVTEIKEVEVYSDGYTKINKVQASGSYYKVNNKTLNRTPSTNIIDRLLYVTSSLNYTPEKSGNIISVRGVSTINANKDPLIVVDNFPYDGSINSINPNDIESVTVLKDAAAASIWGVRAGNGVIVITTKKGISGRKPKVSFTANSTFSEKPNFGYINAIGTSDYISFEKQMFDMGYYDNILSNTFSYPVISDGVNIMNKARNGEISKVEAEKMLGDLQNGSIISDLKKYMVRNGINQQYNINIAGSTDLNRYYVSLGYDKNNFSAIGNNLTRYTALIENQFELKKFSVSSTISYGNTQQNSRGASYSNLIPIGHNVTPYTQLKKNGNNIAIPYQFNSNYIDSATYPKLLDWHYVPLDEVNNSKNIVSQKDLRIAIGVTYKILEELNIDVKYQYQNQVNELDQVYYESSYYARDLINKYMNVDMFNNVSYPIPMGGIINSTSGSQTSNNIRAQLNFTKKIKKHFLNSILGYEVRENKNNILTDKKYGVNFETNTSLPVDYINDYPVRPLNIYSKITYDEFIIKNINRFRSYFFAFNYTYNNYLTLTGSGRLDQSNFFGVKTNQKQLPLWSFGANFDLLNSPLIKSSDFFNLLKLRTTYGYSGNTNNVASSLVTIKYGINSDLNIISATLNNPPNPSLRWEKVGMLNIGVDFSIFKNRISGSLEYYNKNSKDLISFITTDPTVGVTQYLGNNATMKGHGFDIILNTINIKSDKVNFYTNLLFSINSNKVTSYEQQPKTVFDYIDNNQPVINKPLDRIYSLKYANLNESGDPQIFIDGKIDSYDKYINAKESDLVYGGATIPKYFGSLMNTIEFSNGLSLSLNLTYKFSYFFRAGSINYNELFFSWGGHNDYLNRWKKKGDELTTKIPSIPSNFDDPSRDYAYLKSNVLIEKGDYIRLQDIKLQYNLNPQLLQRLQVNSLSLFVNVNNVGLLWKANKRKLDPEYPNISSIPPSRSYSLGVNLNF